MQIHPKLGNRGFLLPVDISELPLDRIKRVFYVGVGTMGDKRGFHAHKTGSQVIVCVKPTIDVHYRDKDGFHAVKLDKIGSWMLLKPMSYAYQFYSPQSSIMVLCDDEYNEKDYIRDYDQFKLELKIDARSANPIPTVDSHDNFCDKNGCRGGKVRKGCNTCN